MTFRRWTQTRATAQNARSGVRSAVLALLFVLLSAAACLSQTAPLPLGFPAASASPGQPGASAPAAAPTSPGQAAVPIVALPELAPTPRPAAANVTAGGQNVFPITAAIGTFTPAARAAAASRKLAQLINDPSAAPEAITLDETESGTEIVCGDLILTRVTDVDADLDPIGRTRQALAADHVADLRKAVVRVRDEGSAKSLSIGALKAAAATLVLLIVLFTLHFLFPRIYTAIEARRGTHIRTIRIQSVELLSEERITATLVQVARLVRFALAAILLYFFIPLVFSFFARTRHFGFELVSYVLAPIRAGWIGFFDYLPRLLVVLVVAFFTWQVLKLARFLFKELERGNIVVTGFYAEWAMPTHRIAEIFIVAFAIVVAFPYLPGSNSAAFRGVSIFLGVLLSLGSSSAIANIVAGVLLTYTRAFRIGDRVQIADTTGDVIEKTLLATHVRTIKNVDITIPNGLVLGSHIINFSRSTAELPLILNTDVAIGYDASWRQVHELLIAAANATLGILKQPAPFVLQTSLDDFYVRYQINAYTAQPAYMAQIYSDLNQQIVERCNQAGVVIMNPHYQVTLRNPTGAEARPSAP